MSRLRLAPRPVLLLVPVLVLTIAAIAPAGGPEASIAPPDGQRFAVCFAPGTSPAVVQDYTRRFTGSPQRTSVAGKLQEYTYTDGDRWSTTATNRGPLRQGDPMTLTWSIVPDGTSIYGYAGEPSAASNLRQFLNSVYGNETTWRAILQRVYDGWGSATGITYVYEPNDDGAAFGAMTSPPGQIGVRGDIRVSGHRIDGNYGILAYNFFPDNGDMVIDTADQYLRDTSDDSLILRNTLAHEHGHGIGLDHVCPMNETKLMEPFLSTRFDGPQHDDILAANRAYGDTLEHNDSRTAASDVGALVSGTPLNLTNLSIDDDADGDYLLFRVSGPATLDVKLDPVGSTYLSGPQYTSGNCSPGTSFNSLNIHNLGFEVLDSSGAQLASVNSAPAGSSEQLTGLSLPSASSYYVHVFGGNASQPQMYKLRIEGQGGSASPMVYESSSPTIIVDPGNLVGLASTSPFAFMPSSQPLLYYAVDDGSGRPSVIRIVKNGTELQIHF